MVTVDVLILSGAMPSSVAITADMLATANLLRRRDGRPPVFGARLIGSGAKDWRPIFAPVAPPGEEAAADVLIVPGLGWATGTQVRERLAAPDAAQGERLIQAALARGAEVATSCSGVFLAAAAGGLDGRRATTSWWLAPLFRRLFPKVELDTDAVLVRDGPVTTAGAALAQTDLMLSLIARHADPALAETCARYMLLDERRSQARYMALGFLTGADPQVARAETFARARLDQELSVGQLADAAGLSPRTFARRVEDVTGLSPIRFLQRLRIETAVGLLESSRLPVDEVARRVGYADPSALRRIMRRDAGLLPSRLRDATVVA